MSLTIIPDPATVPDTRDLVVVHRVFRREFRLLPRLVRATAAGDDERASLVADWAIDMAEMLHHHHTNEDELVWPLLRERAMFDDDLVRVMERQHDQVATLLSPIEPLAQRWRAEPTVTNREVLARALDMVVAPLVEHLDLEEREILPLVRMHLTKAEYDQLGERGRAAIPKDRMLAVLGALLEDATDAEAELMTADMPKAAKAIWAVVGKRQYRKAMNALRAPL